MYTAQGANLGGQEFIFLRAGGAICELDALLRQSRIRVNELKIVLINANISCH